MRSAGQLTNRRSCGLPRQTPTESTVASTDETYTYDDNGNRTNSGFGVTTNNRLTTDGTYNYAYDDEGNITRRTKISDGSYVDYEWDHRNRLISVTDKTGVGTQTQRVTYSYDAFNRLVQRTFQTIGGSPITTGCFVHDGDQIVLELESDGDAAHRLLWGPAVDEALADETGAGSTYWYLTDHLGTVRDVATYSGGVTTIANHIAFDSFGRRASETNTALGDFDLGFTGKWLDRATGLQWNQNRWYNPSIQRWMSEDPIGFKGGDANLSRYVGNEPTSITDPTGLVADPLSEAEKEKIIDAAQDWFKDYAKNGKGWPAENCEAQAVGSFTDSELSRVRWQHWTIRGVSGTRPVWFKRPPGSILPFIWETENAIGVFPNGSNPCRPFVIDVFHGYDNGAKDVTIYPDIDDFFEKWSWGQDQDSWKPKPSRKKDPRW
jgi:RHS repeat-associated protein